MVWYVYILYTTVLGCGLGLDKSTLLVMVTHSWYHFPQHKCSQGYIHVSVLVLPNDYDQINENVTCLEYLIIYGFCIAIPSMTVAVYKIQIHW